MRLDRKRHKGSFEKPPPPTERVRLDVPYEKKHLAKNVGRAMGSYGASLVAFC